MEIIKKATVEETAAIPESLKVDEKLEEEPEEIKTDEMVGDNVADIVDSIIEKSPNVSEHVIAQEGEKIVALEAELEKYPGFDPEIHCVDENGVPIPLKKSKGWRKRPGKKKGAPGNGLSGDSTLGNDSQLGNIGANSVAPETKMAGQAAAHLVFQAGQMIGGEEWQPVVDPTIGLNEATQMEQAFTNYFHAKDIKDFPPGIALSICLAAYAGPRFMMPKTKTRTSRVFGWAKRKLKRNKKVIDEKHESE